MKIKKTLALISTAALTTVFAVGCGSSSGYSSSGDAIKGFTECLWEGDIEGVMNAAAPEKFWDYLVKDTGLNKEKLFYKLLKNEAEAYKNDPTIYKKDAIEYQGISDVDDIKIEHKNEESDYVYHKINSCMHEAGIEENAEDIYYVDTNLYEGYYYQIDGDWYFGPEFFIEEAWDMFDIEIDKSSYSDTEHGIDAKDIENAFKDLEDLY